MSDGTQEQQCGCGKESTGSASFRLCGICKHPLCSDCAECSDMDETGDFCAPCWEREVL